MNEEQKAQAIKLAETISVATMSAENKLAKAIKNTAEAVRLADEVAGENRTGNDAKFALRLRKHQENLTAALAAIKATHCEASILQCEVLGIPMTRGGER